MKKEKQNPKTRQAERRRVEKQVIPMPRFEFVKRINTGRKEFKIITNSKKYKILMRTFWKWIEIREVISNFMGAITVELTFDSKDEAEQFIKNRFGEHTTIIYEWHSV